MFEKEIRFISDYTLNKIKKLGAFFTFEQLQSLDIHPSILKYVDAELDYLLFQDRKKILNKSAFDYSAPEIEEQFKLINSEIKKRKKISFEDARNLIIQAVSFIANYVARPKWSLTKFIFNEDQVKSIDEVRLSLNYLYYYDYLKNVFKAYIEKRKSVNLSLVDFEIAMNKTDKELFTVSSKQLIDNALFSMTDFFSIGGTNSSKVSPFIFELFLKEKDLVDFLFRLRRALPIDMKQQYRIEELQKIIYVPGKIDKTEVLSSRDEPDKVIVEEEKPVETDESNDTSDKIENEDIIETEEINESKEIEENEVESITEHSQENTSGKIELDSISSEKEEIEYDPESETELNDQKELFDFKEKESPEGEESILNLDVDEDILKEPAQEGADEGLNDIIDDLDFSSDNELLDAFDSQLKALEEESKTIPGADENTNEEKERDKADNVELEKSNEKNTQDDNSAINSFPTNLSVGDEDNVETDDAINESRTDNSDENKEDEELNESNEDQEIVISDFDFSDKKDQKAEPSKKKKIPQREKDLFSYLSDKEIDRIVTNVFNEDREDFANSMEKISECLNYDEATEILKGVFFSYRVNPYTRDAVALTNAVSNYFNQA